MSDINKTRIPKPPVDINVGGLPRSVRDLVKSQPWLYRAAVAGLNWFAYTVLPPIRFRADVLRKRINQRRDKAVDDAVLMINVGGGSYFRRHWRVLDFPSPHYNWASSIIDYAFDLTQRVPFPFETGSVAFFFTSHTLEHIPQEHCQHILNEMFRCLRPGGAARLTMPDFDLGADAFRKNDVAFFAKYPGDGIEERFLDFFATYLKGRVPASSLREAFRTMTPEAFADHYTASIPRQSQEANPSNHVTWWNYAKLDAMLRTAGFTQVYRSTPQGSRFAELRGEGRWHGFDSTHPEISLFVEAVKDA